MDLTFRSDIVVEPISHNGGDWLIVDAAKVSNKGKAGSGPRDLSTKEAGLIRDLMEKRHGGPFQHGSLTVYVEAPMFVWWEWRTHKIGVALTTDDSGYSSQSGRWRPLQPVFWVPDASRHIMPVENYNRMAPMFRPPTAFEAGLLTSAMQAAYERQWESYQSLLENNVSAEAARSILGAGVYYAAYVTMNPRSLLHFLSLRTHEETAMFVSYPQWEIEQAARKLETAFRERWPVTAMYFDRMGRVGP